MTVKTGGPRERQKALTEKLVRAEATLAIISDPRHVYYMSGFFTHRPRFAPFLLLDPADGSSTLFVGESERERTKGAHATEVTTFPDYQIRSRMVAYPDFVAEELAKVVGAKLGKSASSERIGIEEWHLAREYSDAISKSLKKGVTYSGLSNWLIKMRMMKSQDEIDLIAKAVRRVDLAYETASGLIREGSTELDLYSNINKMIFDRFGAFNFGERPNIYGDFISGERTLEMSGPPTRRKFRRSDTVILDLAAPCDNYWGDTARTFVVGGKPTDAQRRVHKAVLGAKKAAERLLRPGTTGGEIYTAVSAALKDSGYSEFLPHHAGHALGLEDQEAPFFLPNSKEKLAEGMVCAVEPGIYRRPEGGMRIEDNYVITGDGFRKLSRYPVGIE